MANENLRVFFNTHRVQGRIIHRTRKKKDIIFGAQSIKKQIGLTARPTKDFDIFTNSPKKSANKIEMFADKTTRSDSFYVKKGRNPGTWKVKSVGRDRIRGSKDDETIVDYTKFPIPRPKFINVSGVRYRALSEERKAKLKLLRDPKFSFRREKDFKDLKIINSALRRMKK